MSDAEPAEPMEVNSMNAILKILVVIALGLLTACAGGNPRLVSKINAAYGTSFPAGASSYAGLGR